MKRIKAACILQTLVFSQKEDAGLTPEQALVCSREEVENYRRGLVRTGSRHQITEVTERQDGSIVVRVRKQYNGKAETEEYFI